ncbi:MAG: thioredoxin domain-containing protein [Gemmatimonadaceae bacterium]
MNALRNETSPYLLQHAENPVDWYPWGETAISKAKDLDRPILLSIGYAACHWCHVMAHESFEDKDTARLMNELFINVKVDREERPDLDSIYMQAVQAMTGSGGWPMTVFLTPEGVPFFGGTYYPKDDRHGLPSFSRVLKGVANAYHTQRERVDDTGRALREIYTSSQQRLPLGDMNSHGHEQAFRVLVAMYDEHYAGFGGAPKFPPSMTLRFLMSHWARTQNAKALEMAEATFLAMLHGGIYDQVGGGLHRYSVDERWLVPHFEKMLYDNAQFVGVGVALWQCTGNADVRRGVEETLTWLAREMTSADGGFYSSLDADSEGHEGKFYVWNEGELKAIVGNDFDIVRTYWGVTPGGNFEGTNILFVPNAVAAVAGRYGATEAAVMEAIARSKSALYDVRSRRVWPGRDEKVVTSWNALMLRALAEAARAFDDPKLRLMALTNGEFLWQRLVPNGEGRVLRTYKNGRAKGAGFLEDQAGLALAFLEMYALTLDRRWMDRALLLTDRACEMFYDRELRLFFDTAHDHENLIARPRDVADNATPSGQSVVAELLLRVAEYTGNEGMRELGEDVLRQLWNVALRTPMAFGQLLAASDSVVHGAIQVVLAGDPQSEPGRAMQTTVAQHFTPSLVLAGGDEPGEAPLALSSGKVALDGVATAYVCRRYLCDAPTHHPEELATQLRRAILPGS